MLAEAIHIARPRVDTKDLSVHITTEDGYWHRLHPSTVKTACGLPVNFYRAAPRPGRDVPEHPLAPCDCWTRAERAEADSIYRQKFGRDFEP